MKTFSTLTEYDILHNAYDNLLNLWVEAKDRNQRAKRILGHDSIIEQDKIDKYWSQIEELHSELLRLEQKEIHYNY